MNVGITGHQNLGSSQQYNDIAVKLKQIITEHDVTCGYTCLAKGADQLFAEILKKIGIPYHAIIPSENYDRTFDESISLLKYQDLLDHAVIKKVLSFPEPEEKAFYEAGKYVVESTELLIAIWDGQSARGLGGTGDIVKYCLSLNKNVIHLNTNDLSINILSSSDC
ncbi:hypothetical protein [Bacillus altitudinis]|uniref:hypothetical protein n=1 Tax=Bacillus altitudinis TaxID=293387 RepID=UPI000934CEDC|nr:hypothetical protein [Bacillus altitudinis]OJT54253.1 hypothetical protein BFP48_16875 [Bacillus altitudinis]